MIKLQLIGRRYRKADNDSKKDFLTITITRKQGELPHPVVSSLSRSLKFSNRLGSFEAAEGIPYTMWMSLHFIGVLAIFPGPVLAFYYVVFLFYPHRKIWEIDVIC